MNNLIFLATIFILPLGISAQDVKIKRKKVKVDKKTVLVYDGYASVFKGGVELQYNTPDDEPLFRLRQLSITSIHPLIPTLYWHELTFNQSENKARFRLDEPYYSRKKSTELLLEHTDNILVDTDRTIDEKEEWVLANKDESESILKDSADIARVKKDISKRLKAQQIDRDREARILLEKQRFSPEQTEGKYYLAGKYIVYQDEVEIGRVEIERGDGPIQNRYLRYSFYKKLDEPFELMGERKRYLIASSFEVDVEGENINTRIITYEDGKRHQYNGPNKVKIPDLESAHYPIATFLVEHGYL